MRLPASLQKIGTVPSERSERVDCPYFLKRNPQSHISHPNTFNQLHYNTCCKIQTREQEKTIFEIPKFGINFFGVAGA